jgi:hypothetical protein
MEQGNWWKDSWARCVTAHPQTKGSPLISCPECQRRSDAVEIRTHREATNRARHEISALEWALDQIAALEWALDQIVRCEHADLHVRCFADAVLRTRDADPQHLALLRERS